tara:strand:+ start:811 stop:1404 length:594 start_codon:yes stop_codon:yes gene_type:complete
MGIMLTERIEKLSTEPLLNDWSKGFLESISGSFQKYGVLTQKQMETFEKIESRFSPQEKQKLVEWQKEYRENHLNKAKIIAQYYLQTGYYRAEAERILTKPEFVPSKNKFKKMTENKYAIAVWNTWITAPKFSDGSKIQIRSNHTLKHKLCMVLNSTQSITSHARGGKCYLVLPFGQAQTIIVEERHMMKPNKKGTY